MMKNMKRVLCLLPLAGALACAADLAGVHSVYLLPMARGMDQYLANRLANEHVFRVVTDPKLADAPKPAVAEPAAKTGDEPKAKPDDEAAPPEKPAHSKAKAAGDEPSSPGLMGKTENTLNNPATSSGFSRARGTVFLVDAKSRQVIWSVYDPPKDFAGKEMNRTASDIVSRLKKELNPKK
jgi:hypothetical protein